MLLNEIIKPFLKNNDEIDKIDSLSSIPRNDNVIHVIDDEPIYADAFFDSDYMGLGTGRATNIGLQQAKIDEYRRVAQRPEVQNGIHEIINEIVFTNTNDMPLKVHQDIDNESIQQKIRDQFNKVSNLMRLDLKLFQIVKQGYVDGQIIFHIAYGKDLKEGIQKATMLDPKGFYWNDKEKCYMYEGTGNTDKDKKNHFSPEEIVRVDFGLRDGTLILSYLESVIKVSNMLQSLEDMLIPLRFSRSISRRVFNVDIGDLPPKRGRAVMNEYQRKFKYKKHYNSKTGEITNQQHITSMVEDYWFQNRSGGKGTQVDVLDEQGNLGELDDIYYFNKKLYESLGVPVNRQGAISDRYSQDFDFGQTNFSQEEVAFYLFVSRLRKVYEELFKDILRREVISTGIMTQEEWDTNSHYIRVVFTSELIYLDKIKMYLFTEKIGAFRDQMDYMGKIFSQKTQIKNIFNLTEEEIIEEMEEIKKELKDPLFSHLYQDNY